MKKRYDHTRLNLPEDYNRDILVFAASLVGAAVHRNTSGTREDLISYVYTVIAKGVCEVTGVPLVLELHHPYKPSIDRIDNNKGYTIGNIQVVCTMYNYTKNKYSDKDAVDFIMQAADNLRSSTSLTPCNIRKEIPESNRSPRESTVNFFSAGYGRTYDARRRRALGAKVGRFTRTKYDNVCSFISLLEAAQEQQYDAATDRQINRWRKFLDEKTQNGANIPQQLRKSKRKVK